MNCNTVYFRVDSSIKMGTGHLMRCLTLAEALREKKATVSFICRELLGNICDFIEKQGFKTYRLPFIQAQHTNDKQSSEHTRWLGISWEEDAEQTEAIMVKEGKAIDWLIIDHYALDKRWESFLRPFVKKIMVIDDLADRPHDCDLLLDQNLYENIEIRYNDMVPNHCQKLLGPKYALLRPEFKEARKNLKQRDGMVKRILVFFGGSDPTNETTKALEAIHLLNLSDITIDVVVGVANPHKEQIKQLCATMPKISFYCQVDNIAQLMANADLAIGAGGTVTWERCCLGLPSLVIAIAENQIDIIENLAQHGSIINLGWYVRIKESDISASVENILENPNRIRQMRLKGMRLVDADGTNRVTETLKEIDTK
ncbi:MAG: UDP-2,4-diacetamido-2,4,6-trideoxy-beta-L-altropyranose hydrolase [Candidatus Brocadiaceae bacterium]